MIGVVGVAQTALVPAGKVFVNGELWNAVAGAEVSEGTRVRVNAVDGLRLVVEPARDTLSA
jgi:membrane-bound serine protease (ClpP class)